VKKIIILAAGLSAAGFSVPAMAQTATPIDAAPVGARVEALIAFDHVRVDASDIGAGHITDNGLGYGLGGGFDFGNGGGMSFGVDVEGTKSTQKLGSSDVYIKAGRDLYAGGRVSFAIGGGSNVYLKAGYTNARFKGNDGFESVSDTFNGVRVGVGAQASLRGKAYAGLEYRYSNYEAGLERHQAALVVGTRF